MQLQTKIWILTLAVFAAVAAVAAVIGFYLERKQRVQKRLWKEAPAASAPGAPVQASTVTGALTGWIDEDFAAGLIDPNKRSSLRVELVRAGFFAPEAVSIFMATKIVSTGGLAVLGFIGAGVMWPDSTFLVKALSVAALAYLGYLLPDIVIARIRKRVETAYRIAFPDLLDLLIVCTDAGLSINAALDRVSMEFQDAYRPLGVNMSIALSEIRSGRSFPDALEKLSDRLGIDEAQSFTTLIKQSIELGADIGDAMRVFANEMRSRRLLRAEEYANTLPVKMLLPLGLFIFPVLMMMVMGPAVIKIMAMFRDLNGG
jgi:tight adherence protein C